MASVSPTSTKNNDLLSKRRRFQPPITTFFSTSHSAQSSPHVSHNHYAASTCSPTPTVPATVQASLLSVGMRVRKSVADGYKTKFDTIQKEKQLSYAAEAQAAARGTAACAELAPFCGMTKSCSDAGQSLLTTDDGDAFSLPPSSQESAASVSSVGGMKRSLDAYDEIDELDDGFLDDSWQDVSAGGASPVFGRTILAPSVGQQRRRFIASQRQRPAMDVDDFEEPTFLRSREEVDMEFVPVRSGGREVQMGGI